MLLAKSLVITHLVRLATRGGSNEDKIIEGTPAFKDSKCGDNPETSKTLLGIQQPEKGAYPEFFQGISKICSIRVV